MDEITLPVKRLSDKTALPRYAYDGDAGMDLQAACDVTLRPFERMAVPCGLALAIPEGYVGLVVPRSGLAAKHGVSIVNAPGIIDSNYRGEIKATLINLDPRETYAARAGDRIAQLVIVAVAQAHAVEARQLDETSRGERGFGSSGVDELPPK